MDIWLTECRKTVPKCHYCREPINLHEIMVVGKLWRTSKEEGQRRWVIHFRWHAQKQIATDAGPMICCWLAESMEYLANHPYEETRGRKCLILNKEEKSARLKILRRRARLVQQLKTLMEAPLNAKDTDAMIKIGSKIEELKEQILPLGGVPVSWE